MTRSSAGVDVVADGVLSTVLFGPKLIFVCPMLILPLWFLRKGWLRGETSICSFRVMELQRSNSVTRSLASRTETLMHCCSSYFKRAFHATNCDSPFSIFTSLQEFWQLLHSTLLPTLIQPYIYPTSQIETSPIQHYEVQYHRRRPCSHSFCYCLHFRRTL